MSESTFPFPGAASDLPAEPEAEAGSRKLLLALAGVGAAAVLGVGAYFLVFAGGDSTEQFVAPVTHHAAAPAPTATPTPAPELKISDANFGKDPFKPLVVELPPAAAAPAPAPTTAGGSATGATTGTAAPAPSTSHVFQVVSVAPDNSTVTVKVDGVTYRYLRAGRVFATYFKVLLIGGSVNSFQFGDEKFNIAGTRPISIAG